ncbi:MAG: hypothetical protein ABW044_03435 [Cellvibrio sp.]
MSYSLHIVREQSISLEEWISSVEKIKGARINCENVVAINPKTHKQIEISGSPGNVSVLYKRGGLLGFGARVAWETTIWFFNGRGSFVATEQIENPKDPTRIVAVKLASMLSAEIVGDEGEVYKW